MKKKKINKKKKKKKKNETGDLRYVGDDEFAQYKSSIVDDQLHSFSDYLDSNQRKPFHANLRDKVNEKGLQNYFPQGFIEHRELYKKKGKYGEWLLKKNFIEIIGNNKNKIKLN